MTLRQALGASAVAVVLFSIPALAPATPPSRERVALQDVSGHTTDLDSVLDGRPTLLVVWATWCPSCTREVPRLKDVEARFAPKGLNLVAVNPGMRDDLGSMRRYAERYGLNYPVYLNPDHSVLARFGVRGTPTLLLLDPTGREVGRSHEVDEGALARFLAAAGQPPQATEPSRSTR